MKKNIFETARNGSEFSGILQKEIWHQLGRCSFRQPKIIQLRSGHWMITGASPDFIDTLQVGVSVHSIQKKHQKGLTVETHTFPKFNICKGSSKTKLFSCLLYPFKRFAEFDDLAPYNFALSEKAWCVLSSVIKVTLLNDANGDPSQLWHRDDSGDYLLMPQVTFHCDDPAGE